MSSKNEEEFDLFAELEKLEKLNESRKPSSHISLFNTDDEEKNIQWNSVKGSVTIDNLDSDSTLLKVGDIDLSEQMYISDSLLDCGDEIKIRPGLYACWKLVAPYDEHFHWRSINIGAVGIRHHNWHDEDHFDMLLGYVSVDTGIVGFWDINSEYYIDDRTIADRLFQDIRNRR